MEAEVRTEHYGKVAVSAATYAIDRPYTYHIPAEMADRAVPGMRVMVPFSRGNRLTEGILLSRWESAERIPNTKDVRSLLDEQPVLSAGGLKLALWMRERCFCTVYKAARVMLPAGISYAARDRCRLKKGLSAEEALERVRSAPVQKQIVEYLLEQGGETTREKLYAALGQKSLAAPLKNLEEKEVIERFTSVSRSVGDKTEQIALLCCPLEEAMTHVGRSKPQAEVVTLLAQVGSASVKDIRYFTGASSVTVKTLEKKGLVTLFEREVYRRPPKGEVEHQSPPELNEEQQAAFEGISALLDKKGPACALLYGVTGSGKTQVYIRLIHKVIAEGKTALMLVPEIALTPQLLRHFEAQFGERVAILHSSLAPGARYDEWKRARDGKAQVVVGTRSAVFAPLKNLGLVVLDEEQESSYKSDNTPRYHARDIAKYRCSQSGAVLLLGSATPSVESMYFAQKGVYHLFRLRKRYNEQAMPKVRIVDMRAELRGGNNTSLSGPLKRELAKNLERGEQAVLFLNRRGTSRMVVCASCGEAPECPRCSVKLTYHKDNRRLMCHYCGYSRPMFSACPVCGGELYQVDAGVQLVQEQMEEAFPQIITLRMDADSISASNRHADVLARFEREKVPVLLGTQMVAKGLDFENVTLVGALDADQGMCSESFRAGERTFSLLTQVVGRAGRGKRKGRAVIQTFTPDNDIITCAARQDYDAFYESEIRLRELRGAPPVRDHYLITVTGQMEHQVLEGILRLKNALLEWQRSPQLREHPFDLYGPAEAAVLKVMGRYRYRLTVVCRDDKAIRGMLAYVMAAFQKDRANQRLSVIIDKNPME